MNATSTAFATLDHRTALTDNRRRQPSASSVILKLSASSIFRCSEAERNSV